MENYTTYKPEWAPSDAGKEFACQVMSGIDEVGHPSEPGPARFVRKQYTVDDYVEGVLRGDRMMLAKAITLIESNAPKHFALGQEILQRLLPHTGNSVRVGITGVPGAGKSTFIEALGNYLCNLGKKVAVLAVDPSSSVSKGSILGDKTRMETLSKRSDAFIRPSPSGGTLGGISDGSDLVFRAAFKPTPSIASAQQTVNRSGEEVEIEIHGRHDPIIVPRAVVVVEAMTALTVCDLLLVSMSSRMEWIQEFFCR